MMNWEEEEERKKTMSVLSYGHDDGKYEGIDSDSMFSTTRASLVMLMSVAKKWNHHVVGPSFTVSLLSVSHKG
jgi:hypothetical protein